MQHECCLLNVIFPSVSLSSVTVSADPCVQSSVRSYCIVIQSAWKLFLYNACHAPYLPQRNCGYNLNLVIFFPGDRKMNNSFFRIWSSLNNRFTIINSSYFMSYIYLLVLIEFYRLTLVPWKCRETSQSIARETRSKNLTWSKICHHFLHSINCPVHNTQKMFHIMSMLIKRENTICWWQYLSCSIQDWFGIASNMY